MAFKPENKLEDALVRAVSDRSAAPEFYRLLLESDLLVLGTVQGQEDNTDTFSAPPGSELQLVAGEKNGQKFLPIFSSLTRMQDYVKVESKYLTVNGRGLFETTRGAPLVLNPASEYGKELAPHEIAMLLGDGAPRGEPKVVIGEADFPTALLDALTGVFQSRPDVQAAWMIQVTFADRAHEPHPLVGIECTGDMTSLVQSIQQAAERDAPGQVFDIQRVNRNQALGMTEALLKVEPFYQRGVNPVLRFN